MRYYRPIARELADPMPLEMARGLAVLQSETIAMNVAKYTGACLVLELSDGYTRAGADMDWGHDAGWRTLVKNAPVAGVRLEDAAAFFAQRAERVMLGTRNPTLQELASSATMEGALFRPSPKAIKDFRVLNGRAPSSKELRDLCKWR